MLLSTVLSALFNSEFEVGYIELWALPDRAVGAADIGLIVIKRVEPT